MQDFGETFVDYEHEFRVDEKILRTSEHEFLNIYANSSLQLKYKNSIAMKTIWRSKFDLSDFQFIENNPLSNFWDFSDFQLAAWVPEAWKHI